VLISGNCTALLYVAYSGAIQIVYCIVFYDDNEEEKYDDDDDDNDG